MKKVILIIIFTMLFHSVCYASNTMPKPSEAEVPKTNTQNEDVILLLLRPQILAAVNAFYSEYLEDNPATALFYTNILDIKSSKSDDLGAWYDITVDVMPYVGAHIPIGRDHITFTIYGAGYSELVSFKHVLSYDVISEFPNLKGILKKRLP